MTAEIIQFIRRRDYKFVSELKSGGCGRTVLLFDDEVSQHLVCKKYQPADPLQAPTLYANFVNEIALMYRVSHPNVVRIFSHFLYPDQMTGYILMEYVTGSNILEFLTKNPGQIGSVFRQSIDAFSHLQAQGILHRDIRVENILVTDNGTVKIIDLGFGKQIEKPGDYSKSITLNWPYSPPLDFDDQRYDLRTEIYFVGRLFKSLIERLAIVDVEFQGALDKMVQFRPSNRTVKFSDVLQQLDAEELVEFDFEERDVQSYRTFAEELFASVGAIHLEATYQHDVQAILANLREAHQGAMLEQTTAPGPIIHCFVNGAFRYSYGHRISVVVLKDFIKTLSRLNAERQRIFLSNIQTRLREADTYYDEIPF